MVLAAFEALDGMASAVAVGNAEHDQKIQNGKDAPFPAIMEDGLVSFYLDVAEALLAADIVCAFAHGWIKPLSRRRLNALQRSGIQPKLITDGAANLDAEFVERYSAGIGHSIV